MKKCVHYIFIIQCISIKFFFRKLAILIKDDQITSENLILGMKSIIIFFLQKFYDNLEVKERLFTDARNYSFLWLKTTGIPVSQNKLFKTEDL